jgi:transcriptional regulator with XRE-family HTH domain
MVVAQQKRVPAGPIFDHVAYLLSCEGGTEVGISNASGVAHCTIVRLAARRGTYVLPDNARAIMATTPEQVWRQTRHVPVRKAATRLRALQANGWSLASLAKMLGLSGARAPLWLYAGTLISQTNDRAMLGLYERLGDRPGGSTRARNEAARLGFHPPICYDDDMRLIPEAVAEPSRYNERDLHYRARLRAYAMMATRSLSHREIADLVGTTQRTVERWRVAAGLYGPDHNERAGIIRGLVAGIDVWQSEDYGDTMDEPYKAVWRRLESRLAQIGDAAAA